MGLSGRETFVPQDDLRIRLGAQSLHQHPNFASGSSFRPVEAHRKADHDGRALLDTSRGCNLGCISFGVRLRSERSKRQRQHCAVVGHRESDSLIAGVDT